MANKPPAKPRRQASMPSAAPMPPPPPPVEAQPEAPAPGADPVTERLVQLDVLNPPGATAPHGPQQDAEAPAPPAPQVQQAPPPPEPQASPGSALAPTGGQALARNLGTQMPRESPRDFPREIPRSQVEDPTAVMDQGFLTRGARNREANILGHKTHPRQETTQMNPGMRRFLGESVKIYADNEGIGRGAALDRLLELGLRLEAPELVAERYARRAAALGAMNDWPDGREAVLEMAMRQTSEATVLRVLARLKAEAEAAQQ